MRGMAIIAFHCMKQLRIILVSSANTAHSDIMLPRRDSLAPAIGTSRSIILLWRNYWMKKRKKKIQCSNASQTKEEKTGLLLHGEDASTTPYYGVPA